MKISSRSQSFKTESPRQKNRLTEEQSRILEASFTENKKLEQQCKLRLAYQLGMPAKQVAIWYQNRRARWKTQRVELDYQTIPQKLDSSLEKKWRLQKEVDRLRTELQRAQQMLLTLNYNAPPSSSTVSSSCEENGSNGSSISMVAEVNRNPQASDRWQNTEPCQSFESWESTESWQDVETWESTDSWQSTESWDVEDVFTSLFGEGNNNEE